MIYYEEEIGKQVRTNKIPREIYVNMNNAFIALDATNDLNLFDIKRLKSSDKRTYYRLRKGKYRAIFYIEGKNYFVIKIGKREEIYKKWQ